MRRALAVVIGLLLALFAVAFVGFRIWLARQPNETRLGIEAFGPLEFAAVVRDEFFPKPIDDFGRFGRRSYPGRGHSPWVLRLSLDGRPRILAIALAPECWLAYSTQSAGPHQFWRGGIDFAGPAFDGRHGSEPMSQGAAWWRPAKTQTPWRVRGDQGWEPAAEVVWRGHGFEPKTGRLWLRYELRDGAGRRRTITEWPERIDAAEPERPASKPASSTERPSGSPAEAVGLERVFELAPGAGPDVALAIESPAISTESDGTLEGATLLPLRVGATRLVQWFASPIEALERAQKDESEATSFAQFDCESCHHVHERVVGPAWQEIAHRFAGQNAEASAEQLARTIREGGVGRWGSVPMPPHPELSGEQAFALARQILSTPIDLAKANSAAAALAGVELPAGVETSYASDVGPRPDALHPAWTATPISPPDFTPRVGGLALLPDGRLAVATWDRDGAVELVEGWNGPPESVRIRRIAEGLHEPLGLAFADGALHVIHKQEITRLVDLDGDDWIDEYRTLADDWTTTSNFHEFGFGLPVVDGYVYAGLSVCILKGGKSCREQTEDRGTLIRVSLASGEVERVATGLRTPNGLAAAPDGSILVTDNQGDWLPASKLIRLAPGADYGWRKSGAPATPERVSPPALWLPQNEVGNSPTQPVVLERGPYAGQVLFGDVFNGGIKRAVLEEVSGWLQGAAFHFSGGLRAPVNRLIAAPDGTLVAGEIGSGGNWGELGRPWYGLEVLRFGEEPAFEPMRVSLRRGGFELELSRPLARDSIVERARIRVEDWYYVPTPEYGGPKYDLRKLEVAQVVVSEDRRRIAIEIPGLEAGRVVHLRLDPTIRSERGEPLWADEAWYTINALVDESLPQPWPIGAASLRGDDAMRTAPSSGPVSSELHNRLTDAERAEGWELLFDGESFAGWKNYGAPSDEVRGWAVRDGALEFTRNESFARLVLRHLNPFARPSLDLMTKARFSDFELALDWKIEPGGNSGIFYLVPDESQRLGWTLAPEMQVLDDARHADGRKEKRRAGDLYDVVASSRRAARPAGEWNHARVRVLGPRIEHWLNGVRIVEIDRGTPAWDRAVAESKHAGVEGYARARDGHILLQDHGDAVWYRNLKIRRLEPPAPTRNPRSAQSGSTSPLPPKSLGKSLNLGKPSRTASTFSP